MLAGGPQQFQAVQTGHSNVRNQEVNVFRDDSLSGMDTLIFQQNLGVGQLTQSVPANFQHTHFIVHYKNAGFRHDIPVLPFLQYPEGALQ